MNIKKSNIMVIIVLTTSYLLSCFTIYDVTKMLTGPIIWHDEFLYINLAKSICFNNSYIPGAQYNPLYPYLISFFFKINNGVVAYEAIKIFNACMFSSVIFPLYFLAQDILKKKYLACFYGCIFAFFPWKMVTTTVWAEPLFYPLFAWCMLIFYYYLKKNSGRILFGLGVLLGLLFLTKQAGLLLAFSMMFVLALRLIKESRIKELKKLFYLIIPFGLFVVGWTMCRKMGGETGGLGYESEISNIWDNLLNIKELFLTLGYTFSYYSVACCICVLSLAIFSLIKIRLFNNTEQWFMLNCGLYAVLISILSAFHYIGLKAPYGRYQTVIVPYIFLIAIMLLESNIKLNRIFLLLINIAVLGISILFNPLFAALSVKAYVNQLDLSIWTEILTGGNIPFAQNVNVVSENIVNKDIPIMIVIVYFIFSLVFILMTGRKQVQKILLCGAMLVVLAFSFKGHEVEVRKLAGGSAINDIYRYIITNNISMEQVYKTSQTIGNIYLDSVWFSELHIPTTVESEKESVLNVSDMFTLLSNNVSRFDFGEGASPEEQGYYSVKAPWINGYYYDYSSGIPGFSHSDTYVNGTSTIGGIYNGEELEPLINDGIYGVTENRFMVKKPSGRYYIKIESNTQLMSGLLDVEFSVYVNGKYYGKISDDNQELEIDNYSNNNNNNVIEIELLPEEGKCWLLCSVDILPEDSSFFGEVYIIDFKENEWIIDNMIKYTGTELRKCYENNQYIIYYKP